jgi:hypothetical protein
MYFTVFIDKPKDIPPPNVASEMHIADPDVLFIAFATLVNLYKMLRVFKVMYSFQISMHLFMRRQPMAKHGIVITYSNVLA